MNINLTDSDYWCDKAQFLEMLENVDGLDLECLTFQQYKKLVDKTIKLNQCTAEMNTLIKNKHINKNNVAYTDNQINTMFGFWYNYCEKKLIYASNKIIQQILYQF